MGAPVATRLCNASRLLQGGLIRCGVKTQHAEVVWGRDSIVPISADPVPQTSAGPANLIGIGLLLDATVFVPAQGGKKATRV